MREPGAMKKITFLLFFFLFVSIILPPALPAQEGKPASETGKGKSTDTLISLDFTDVEISALIKFISEVTGKNFIFDEKVRGRVTIISPRKISVDEAYRVFLSVLQVKGYTTVEQDGIVKIIPSREIKQEPTSISTEKVTGETDEYVTQLVPLTYINVRDASTLLSPLISKEGLISFYEPSNTLIVIDRKSNISRILQILSELDINRAAQVIRLYQLSNASADDLAQVLTNLFNASLTRIGPTPRTVRGKGKTTTPTGTVFKGIKFISEPRTNSIIVVSPQELIPQIEEMIEKLDIPTPENVGKINVYYLENADAEELANVLNTLISGRAAVPQTARAGHPQTVKGVITPEFEGAIKITADKGTNSLIIVASPNDYKTLVDVIKKLDIKRRQVYVEAAILEVSIDRARDVGVEFRGAFEPTSNSAAFTGTNFSFTGNINDLLVALAAGNPLLFSGEGISAGVIGGKVILPDGTEIPAITAILRAAQVASNVHVLATPHLLTMDNEEAEIVVGENVPFIVSQQRDTTNLANIINQVERQDVGITLKIKPQIHESNYVKLDIYQEASAVKEGTGVLDPNLVGPTTTKRSAKTNVIVKTGQTVVLGGLMQERKVKKVSKVPLLGDIPLLGRLFRFESTNSQKTNLLIFLTPHIIKDTGELQGITLKMKNSMKTFIEKNRDREEIQDSDMQRWLEEDPFGNEETDGP
ncbi:MAG: type II secretion system protein GspD [Deltaproteobacteria bacterium]|nr:MAG: type II secretion system protein GspD [Deltaproteobacteria bacterium]